MKNEFEKFQESSLIFGLGIGLVKYNPEAKKFEFENIPIEELTPKQVDDDAIQER